MKFIAISEDVLVNPETISSVEKKKSGKITINTVDGKQFIIEKTAGEIISALIRAGFDAPEQFFGG